MLGKISTFFEKHFSDDAASQSPEEQLKLAKAALLTEVSYADHDISEDEKSTLRDILIGTFGIEEQTIEELMSLAESEVREAHSSYQFTRLINEHFNREQKFSLIQAMWEVAYADQKLDHYEEAMIRKLADLLYVPHNDFIKAKLSVQEKQ